MPKFSVTMKKIKFKDKQFLDDTIREVMEIFRWGVADFIVAALPEVNVDTGMSAASLVGKVDPFISGQTTDAGSYFYISNNGINSRRRNRGSKGNPPYYPTRRKPAEGIRTIPHGKELGEYYCYWSGKQIGVNFKTDVWQYKYWEDKKKEWHSIREGKKALKKYFNKEIKKLPNLKDYMVEYK